VWEVSVIHKASLAGDGNLLCLNFNRDERFETCVEGCPNGFNYRAQNHLEVSKEWLVIYRARTVGKTFAILQAASQGKFWMGQLYRQQKFLQ